MPSIEWAFATGIDQRSRPEYTDGSQAWVSLANIRAPKTGGADKRYGFSVGTLTRADATSRSAGHRLYADGYVTSVIDGSTVDGDVRAASVAKSLGRLPEAIHRLIDLPTLSQSGSVEDVEYCSGYFAVTTHMIQGGNDYAAVMILDATTGALVHGPYLLGTFVQPMVCSYGTHFLVIKCDIASTTISVMALDTTSASTINAGWSAAGGSVTTTWSTFYRVSACSMSDRIAIVFGLDAGTDRVGVVTWNAAGLVESTTINTASTTPTGGVDVGIGPNNDTLWVTWNQGNAAKVIGLTPTAIGTTLYTAATIITSTSAICVPLLCPSSTTSGKGRLLVADSVSGFAASLARGFQGSGGATAADGSQVQIPGLSALGRPFAKGGRYYVVGQAGVTSISGTTQEVACVVDFSDSVTWVRPVCNIEPGLAVGATYARSKVVVGSDATKLYTTQNVRRSSVANASALVELDFASTDRWQAVRHGNSTYLAGGVLGYVDGQRFNELGFMHRPPKPTTSTSGTGVTLTLGRRYCVVYEAVDADGNLTVSGVSDPSDSTGAVANKTISVVSQPCAMTYRLDANGLALASMRAVLYATGDTGGVPPYYRHSVVDNDTSSNIVTFTDTTTDASLTSNAKLYEQPGITGSALDRRAPPGQRHLVEYNGLLVGASGSNVWFSGQPVIGEAAWFNPVFQVPIPGDGDITGLAAQDGTLYVFKRTSVYALAGEWPSDNGASGGLGAPQRLAVDVGCIEQRSIVVTALGVFFQSDRGLELLTRARSVEWIGDRVQDEIAARPYVMAATLDQGQAVVYFELASGKTNGLATGTGRGLVFDLSQKTWISADRRYDQAGTADAPAQSACMTWNGSAWRYSWLDTAGYVYTEDQTTHLDPGSRFVVKHAESAWQKPGALQGRQQLLAVKLIAKYATDANVSVALAYDYATTYQAARTWTRAEIAALTAGTGGAGTMPNVHLEHRPHEDGGDCMSVRVQLEDATPTGGTVGTGQGCVWTGLLFDVVPKDGSYRLPDGAR